MTEHNNREDWRPQIGSVHIDRMAGDGLLRRLRADILTTGGNVTRSVAAGAIAWRSELFWFAEEGARAGGELAQLAPVADEIRELDWRFGAEDQIDTVVLVERLVLDGQPCSQQLAGAIVDQIIDLLQIDPLRAVVVIMPGPDWRSDDIPRRPIRHGSDVELSYERSGFRRWKHANAWWALRPVVEEG